MSRTPLLERDTELGALIALLDDALRGMTRVAFIVGEAGIGKTRLAEELGSVAEGRGVRVAWARSWDLDESPPLFPWLNLLRDLGIESAVASGHPVERDSRMESFARFTTTLREEASVSPLVLILDDIHSLDDASAVLLRYLVRYLRDVPILIVCTYRDDEVDPVSVLGQALAKATRDGTIVRPKRLTADAVTAHFAQVAGFPPPAATAGALERAGEGNPLFVEEIARHVAGGSDIRRPDRSVGFRVPAGIEDVFRNKIQKTGGKPLASVLEVAAVLGTIFEARVLEGVLDVESVALMDDLAEADRAGLLEEIGSLGRYGFAHTFLRELLYQRQAPAKRMETHRKAAQVLEQLDPERYIGEIADHLFKAGRLADPQQAFDRARQAGERARDNMAVEDAARHFHRALTIAESLQVDAATIEDLRAALQAVEESAEEEPAEPHDPNVFSREGDFWTVTFGGSTARFKDAKGFRWLAQLLAAPGREFHVLDLAGGTSIERAVDKEGIGVAGSDSGEVIDAHARRAYAERIRELEEELAEAEANNDLERAGRAREELSFLSAELRSATGLGGQPRKIAAESERARVSVTRAVRLAIDKIAKENRALGRHLEATISTGTFVSYTPDPRVPVDWQL